VSREGSVSEGDIDADGRIGPVEAIHLLQSLSGLRP
jgi:hypothetical protein